MMTIHFSQKKNASPASNQMILLANSHHYFSEITQLLKFSVNNMILSDQTALTSVLFQPHMLLDLNDFVKYSMLVVYVFY